MADRQLTRDYRAGIAHAASLFKGCGTQSLLPYTMIILSFGCLKRLLMAMTLKFP
jgi:hypothetical protein